MRRRSQALHRLEDVPHARPTFGAAPPQDRVDAPGTGAPYAAPLKVVRQEVDPSRVGASVEETGQAGALLSDFHREVQPEGWKNRRFASWM